jgi:hypothetical protein
VVLKSRIICHALCSNSSYPPRESAHTPLPWQTPERASARASVTNKIASEKLKRLAALRSAGSSSSLSNATRDLVSKPRVGAGRLDVSSDKAPGSRITFSGRASLPFLKNFLQSRQQKSGHYLREPKSQQSLKLWESSMLGRQCRTSKGITLFFLRASSS